VALRGLFGGKRSRSVANRLAEHQTRAAKYIAALPHSGAVTSELSTEQFDSLPQDEALSVLVVAMAGERVGVRVEDLVRRRLPYTLDDASLLVQLAEENRDGSWWMELVRTRAALSALETRAAEGDDIESLATRVQDVILGPHSYGSPDWTKLARRARKLTSVAEDGQLDLSLLLGDDPWSDQVRPLVSERLPSEGAFLELLASATQSRPSRKWLDTARPLLTASADGLLRLLLEKAEEVPPRRLGSMVLDGREYVNYLWLSDMSATVVRGALWAASLLDDAEWVVPICERLIACTRRNEQLKVSNACFYCLGERADDDAVALLGRLVTQIKDRRFLKPAQAALERAAEKRGITPEQLRERLIPTFGLDINGRAARDVGPADVRIELTPPSNVKLRYQLGDAKTATAPEALKNDHAAELVALKGEVADVRKELAAQRLRLEELLASDRAWEYEEWRQFYLEHPLVQLFARRLIWTFDGEAAIPVEHDSLVGLNGSIDQPGRGTVRLWHPLEASTSEIVGWRTLLRERELRQPFKQAHREIYLLAPAERETRVYSNRFAAHIVRYPQVYALAKQRGWAIRALGPYDNDGGEQWRDFPSHGLRARYWMEMVDDAYAGGAIADLASTDQVRFTHIGEQEPLALDEIPPRVFSETMRDVDLFVGVASIAADPTWIDGGVDRFNAYWREHAFGELGESAKLRREVLEDVIPGLKIAERLELEDRYLRVRGKLHTYRIHLGSANILIEPDDRYLCIVPGRNASTGKLFLPFEDERLSIILSKALLLATDDKITDPTIQRQLG
jgi:Domain of unknown function (DUF4132)